MNQNEIREHIRQMLDEHGVDIVLYHFMKVVEMKAIKVSKDNPNAKLECDAIVEKLKEAYISVPLTTYL